MVDGSADDDERVVGVGCDDIESIMRCTQEPGGRRQRQCSGDPSAFSGQVQASYMLMRIRGQVSRCRLLLVRVSVCVLRVWSAIILKDCAGPRCF